MHRPTEDCIDGGGSFGHLSPWCFDICVSNYTNVEEDDARRREKISAYKWGIISYDVTRRRASVAARVAEFVHGRKVRVPTKTGIKTYHYRGIVSKSSVERIGQSVLMMWEKDAEDFHRFLVGLDVPHSRLVVWVDF